MVKEGFDDNSYIDEDSLTEDEWLQLPHISRFIEDNMRQGFDPTQSLLNSRRERLASLGLLPDSEPDQTDPPVEPYPEEQNQEEPVAHAIVYKHGFAMGGVPIEVGNYPYDRLVNERGIENDQISAIKVAEGKKARLYQHGNFKGWIAEFPGEEWPFSEYGYAELTDPSRIVYGDLAEGQTINDDTSSIKLYDEADSRKVEIEDNLHNGIKGTQDGRDIYLAGGLYTPIGGKHCRYSPAPRHGHRPFVWQDTPGFDDPGLVEPDATRRPREGNRQAGMSRATRECQNFATTLGLEGNISVINSPSNLENCSIDMDPSPEEINSASRVKFNRYQRIRNGIHRQHQRFHRNERALCNDKGAELMDGIAQYNDEMEAAEQQRAEEEARAQAEWEARTLTDREQADINRALQDNNVPIPWTGGEDGRNTLMEYLNEGRSAEIDGVNYHLIGGNYGYDESRFPDGYGTKCFFSGNVDAGEMTAQIDYNSCQRYADMLGLQGRITTVDSNEFPDGCSIDMTPDDSELNSASRVKFNSYLSERAQNVWGSGNNIIPRRNTSFERHRSLCHHATGDYRRREQESEEQRAREEEEYNQRREAARERYGGYRRNRDNDINNFLEPYLENDQITEEQRLDFLNNGTEPRAVEVSNLSDEFKSTYSFIGGTRRFGGAGNTYPTGWSCGQGPLSELERQEQGRNTLVESADECGVYAQMLGLEEGPPNTFNQYAVEGDGMETNAYGITIKDRNDPNTLDGCSINLEPGNDKMNSAERVIFNPPIIRRDWTGQYIYDPSRIQVQNHRSICRRPPAL